MCDQRIDQHLHRMETKVDPASNPIPEPTRRGKGSRPRQPHFDLRGHLYRITGVALTQIDSIDVRIAQTVISEVGLDMSRWKTEKHFASCRFVRIIVPVAARCSSVGPGAYLARHSGGTSVRLLRRLDFIRPELGAGRPVHGCFNSAAQLVTRVVGLGACCGVVIKTRRWPSAVTS